MKEVKVKRIKFAIKFLIDRRFRYLLKNTISYANRVCGDVRGNGASDVVWFMTVYGDILNID